MAETAIKTEEEKKEYFDTPEELETKVTQLAEWVRESAWMTFFTGAGISTACGIPDYRSGYGTVLETGPGCWEKAAYKEKFKDDLKKAGLPLPNTYRVPFETTIQQARPSLTHMAMVELQNRGMLKAVISQNVDGLHRKSGIEPARLCELHGNTNLEICMKCEREHMRDFRVRTSQKTKEHKTGRKCDTPGCGGDLKDTIINFGESLNGDVIMHAFFESTRTDLHIAMGSSMRVSPANQMPLTSVAAGGRFVMINLQKTPIDDAANLIIHERVDKVIELLMQKLEIPIPDFRRSYRLRVSLDPKDAKKVLLTGVDSNGSCYTLFKSLKVSGLGAQVQTFPGPRTNVQPYTAPISPGPAPSEFSVECTFQGHYSEPIVTLKVPMDKLTSEKSLEFVMVFHVKTSTFEEIKMLSSENKTELGTTSFTTKDAPRPPPQEEQKNAAPQRKTSPPVRSVPLAKSAQAASTAANRASSTKNSAAPAKVRPAPTQAAKARPVVAAKKPAGPMNATSFAKAKNTMQSAATNMKKL